ncbi:hypothetical protein QBC33DRAFT_590907 [Phialemonium atrogriseum]|uniref:Uncharacterized protein n=1 Tax=Phialemonium atrogriseum TaxID=1093897 RepID=A0AAJ0BVW0_9PEZI|nr:uncharacterized protein QBC33DRAFT_590907 [Phialemonium atrogriseum]KAK1765429.1 hypothetical protein QBC33DRAFT_590907 [Phialemonium atrogriseum]
MARLEVRPMARTAPDDTHQHGKWMEQYLSWREICKCPCGKGYYCRQHGAWVRGDEAEDEYQSERDHCGYPNCPARHYASDPDNGRKDNTGFQDKLSRADDGVPPEAPDEPSQLPNTPDRKRAQASGKHHRSSKQDHSDRKRQSTTSSTASSNIKAKPKSKTKDRVDRAGEAQGQWNPSIEQPNYPQTGYETYHGNDYPQTTYHDNDYTYHGNNYTQTPSLSYSQEDYPSYAPEHHNSAYYDHDNEEESQPTGSG